MNGTLVSGDPWRPLAVVTPHELLPDRTSHVQRGVQVRGARVSLRLRQ